MKNTKKQRSRTFPNIGRVSSSNITSILMDHRILERHLLVIERRAKVFLSDKLVPFTLGMQVLVEETKRSHVAVGKLAQLLLDVSLVVWKST